MGIILVQVQLSTKKGCNSVGRVANCDFVCHGFESHQSPIKKILYKILN